MKKKTAIGAECLVTPQIQTVLAVLIFWAAPFYAHCRDTRNQKQSSSILLLHRSFEFHLQVILTCFFVSRHEDSLIQPKLKQSRWLPYSLHHSFVGFNATIFFNYLILETKGDWETIFNSLIGRRTLPTQYVSLIFKYHNICEMYVQQRQKKPLVLFSVIKTNLTPIFLSPTKTEEIKNTLCSCFVRNERHRFL